MRRVGTATIVGRSAPLALLSATLALASLSGCARTLTITQDKYINTGPHARRPPEQRTGEPLEVDIVCVFPKNLDNPANDLLRPDSKITCRDWYEHRPTGTGAEKSRFELPRNQIYLVTNDDSAYGRRLGTALRGAGYDGEQPIRKTGFEFPGTLLHNSRSVIYVFPKFTGVDGNVLPVPPAKFHPPGAYAANLEIKIGVDQNRSPEEGQYVRVLSPGKPGGE